MAAALVETTDAVLLDGAVVVVVIAGTLVVPAVVVVVDVGTLVVAVVALVDVVVDVALVDVVVVAVLLVEVVDVLEVVVAVVAVVLVVIVVVAVGVGVTATDWAMAAVGTTSEVTVGRRTAALPAKPRSRTSWRRVGRGVAHRPATGTASRCASPSRCTVSWTRSS